MYLLGHVTSNEVFLVGMAFGLGLTCGLLVAQKLFVWWWRRGKP